MSHESHLLDKIQTRRYLDEINHHLLLDGGEIIEAPGKLSLVWTMPIGSSPENGMQRFLAVKASGEDGILINGRGYPATEDGLKQGLRASLQDLLRRG